MPQIVHRQEPGPWFPANQPGKPRSALPTLVAYPQSHAFREGMIFDSQAQEWQPPLPVERERAMGSPSHATRHPQVSDAQRCALLGRAMDVHCLTWFMTLCLVFQMFHFCNPFVALALTNYLESPGLVHLPPTIANFPRFQLGAGGGRATILYFANRVHSHHGVG